MTTVEDGITVVVEPPIMVPGAYSDMSSPVDEIDNLRLELYDAREHLAAAHEDHDRLIAMLSRAAKALGKICPEHEVVAEIEEMLTPVEDVIAAIIRGRG
jgi:hypothetical protein